MIYKTLNLNYSLMPYLRNFLHMLTVAALSAGVTYCPYVAASDSPKIINGQTEDKEDEEQCSQADLNQYVEKIKKDIRAKWQPVKGFADRQVTVVFTVRQTGLIEDAKIIETSGSQEVDQSALSALKSASPLTPLPKGSPEFIQIRYVFSWQVH
jgi:TonB family protein